MDLNFVPVSVLSLVKHLRNLHSSCSLFATWWTCRLQCAACASLWHRASALAEAIVRKLFVLLLFLRF